MERAKRCAARRDCRENGLDVLAVGLDRFTATMMRNQYNCRRRFGIQSRAQ